MSPLSAIPPNALQIYGLRQRPELTPAESTTLPVELQKTAGTTPASSFATVLGQFVQDVNGKQIASADAVNRLQSGGEVSLHQAVIGMEEANVSFQLMVEVRNKLLESYQELMRMQV